MWMGEQPGSERLIEAAADLQSPQRPQGERRILTVEKLLPQFCDYAGVAAFSQDLPRLPFKPCIVLRE